MKVPLRALTILLVLLLGGVAEAGEYGWVPPPPPSPMPPAAVEEAPTMAQRRVAGGVTLLWSKGLQTVYLSLLTTHVILEATGSNGTRLVFPETGFLPGHAAAFIAGPWGYALALDDGRPHRRHMGLAIGLFEQAAYAGLVASLNMLTRELFFNQNGCHIEDPRGCVDHFYRPASRPQAVIMLATVPALLAFGVAHAAAAERLKVLEAAGVMDGPEGDPYRDVYELQTPAPKPRAKPSAMLLPTFGGVAFVGRF